MVKTSVLYTMIYMWKILWKNKKTSHKTNILIFSLKSCGLFCLYFHFSRLIFIFPSFSMSTHDSVHRIQEPNFDHDIFSEQNYWNLKDNLFWTQFHQCWCYYNFVKKLLIYLFLGIFQQKKFWILVKMCGFQKHVKVTQFWVTLNGQN